jgi:hypothetical protein
MKHHVHARITFANTVARPIGPFLAVAKLPSDEPGNPCGQWDLAVDPVFDLQGASPPATIPAFVDFVSAAAPRGELAQGASFDLYYGFKCVARAEVVSVAANVPPVEATERHVDRLGAGCETVARSVTG